MIQRIIFGLGSNLGDREFHLEEAIYQLENNLNLKNPKKSKTLKNPAMLLPNSPKEWELEFLNMAFSADINLKEFAPEKILEIVKEIEKKIGRIDREKWAPREIDIDILAINDMHIHFAERLIIPHPGLIHRDFFLKTVEEIEPEILKKLQAILS